MNWLTTGILLLDRYAIGVPCVLLFSALVALCQLLMRRVLGPERIRQCHEVGGYYLAIVGGFYAVLLGLIVYAAMDKFSRAESTVENEARSILGVYSLASQFGEDGQAIRDSLARYTNEVVVNEWRLMREYKISLTARKIFIETIDRVKKIEPVTENQKALYPVMVSELINLWDSRRDRTKVTNYGIPGAEWALLILGAGITLFFTLFFTIDNQSIHLFMTGLIALLISASLYLVLLFGAPFSGDMRVSKMGFLVAQKIMSGRT